MRAVSTGRGKTLTAAPHTKWSHFVLSILMSCMSLLSKEQGVTVVGVCAAFDVFLHWDTIHTRLWRRNKDSSELENSEKTVVTEQQTKLTRASNNGRNSNINGLSTFLRKSSKPQNVTSRLQSMTQRIGKKWQNLSVNISHTKYFLLCLCVLVCLLVAGVGLVWFRMSMNYRSQPVFKPYEMRAAFHPDRSIRQASHYSNTQSSNADI